MRGYLLTTTGRKLEKIGIRDFLDVVYSYAVNPLEMRNDSRTIFLGYAFDYKTGKEAEEDPTFGGFTKVSLSMIDELDAFQLG